MLLQMAFLATIPIVVDDANPNTVVIGLQVCQDRVSIHQYNQ